MTDPMLNRHSREDGTKAQSALNVQRTGEANNLDSTSSENLITNHIDIWTTAIERKSSTGRGTSKKFSLYGIKKLRELILELAVRGKLVPQDVSDEPASVLLERIAAEKAQLLKDNKIKKQKPLSAIEDGEKLFELPQGWSHIRLDDICFGVTSGSTPPKDIFQDSPGIPYLKVYNIKNQKIDFHHKPQFVEPNYHVNKLTRSILYPGDVVMNIVGPPLGKIAIIPDDFPEWNCNQAIVFFRPIQLELNQYIYTYLTAGLFLKSIELIGTAGQDNISVTKSRSIVIPIPPLEEQHRIVAKVDELMSLCDALEAQTEASIGAHQTLVETLLNALLLPNITQQKDSQSASAEPSFADSLEPALNNSFIDSWQRVAEHFDTLFTTEASIDTLKQTILQLAVMGKLVEQDPNDEPAAKLLERIAAEKARLIKDGKIKKQKPLPAITDEEKPFELPSGWQWLRPDEFSKKITDGEHFKPPTSDKGIYFLSAKDIRDEGVSLDQPLYISEKTATKASLRCDPEYGDLLIVSRGATVGRMCKVNIKDRFCLLGSVILIKPTKMVSSDYLSIVLKSPNVFNQLTNASSSTAQPAIYLRDLKKVLLPLAPLSEQHRIVARVDELMALCNQLKAHLSDARTTQLHLTDAIVEHALN